MRKKKRYSKKLIKTTLEDFKRSLFMAMSQSTLQSTEGVFSYSTTIKTGLHSKRSFFYTVWLTKTKYLCQTIYS